MSYEREFFDQARAPRPRRLQLRDLLRPERAYGQYASGRDHGARRGPAVLRLCGECLANLRSALDRPLPENGGETSV